VLLFFRNDQDEQVRVGNPIFEPHSYAILC
jgi:hypothetical protein